MPLLPAGDVLDLDPTDESEPDAWWRRAQLPEDAEAALVEFGEEGGYDWFGLKH